MDDCFFVYLLATFRRWFYVVGVQIISSHIVYETNQEEEIKKWLSLNRARNTNVVNKAHNRHQNNFPKSSYLGVALAHTMRVSERASALRYSFFTLQVGLCSLLLSSTLPRQFSISAMSQQSMQKRVCDSLAPPSLRRSCGSLIIVVAQTHKHTPTALLQQHIVKS